MLSHDVDLAALQPQLIGWLQRKMRAARELSISDVERSGAGFTNVSIPFTLRWTEGGQQKTAGMLSPATSAPVYPDFKLERQFRLLQALQGTEVPVPKVHWMEHDERVLGFPFTSWNASTASCLRNTRRIIPSGCATRLRLNGGRRCGGARCARWPASTSSTGDAWGLRSSVSRATAAER